MPETYYIPPEVAEQGIKSHPSKAILRERGLHYRRALQLRVRLRQLPQTRTQPALRIRRNYPGRATHFPDSGWPGGKLLLPAPSWLVLNTRALTPTRRAGGIHCVFALEVPIARHNEAHTAPLSYLAHVADRLAHHLGADPGYTGLITRNPINPGPECFTHWGRMFPYTLERAGQAATEGQAAVTPVDRYRAQL